jgi:hypothetical protein
MQIPNTNVLLISQILTKKNHNKESKKPLYNFFNLKGISVIT